MVKIAFYTITGQTQRFIDKTGLDAHRIEDAHPQYQMNDKYILILPSYQDFMMDSVVEFLTYKDNKDNLLGLIGCGNRNFNDLFAQTAKRSQLHYMYLFFIYWSLVAIRLMSKMFVRLSTRLVRKKKLRRKLHPSIIHPSVILVS